MTARWGWFLAVSLLISLTMTVGTQFIFLEKSFFREIGFGATGAWVGFANYAAALQKPLYLNSIITTLRVAAAATLGCLLLGFPLAYVIARATGRLAIVMLSGILLTSLVSAPIKVLGLTIIFSKEGMLNHFLLWSGLTSSPISLLGTELGVIVGLIYYSLAFAVLLLFSVIRTIPVVLEDSAAILGAGRMRVFLRVIIPLSLPGIFAVGMTVFSLSMGAFAAAALMGGGRVLTLPVLIYQTIFIETKYATASTLAAILLVLVLLVNLLAGLMTSALTAKWHRGNNLWLWSIVERFVGRFWLLRIPIERRLRFLFRIIGKVVSAAWMAWVYFLLFAPLFVIVGASFNGGSFRAGAIVFPPRHFSLDWYISTPASHVYAFGVSIALAFISTLLACIIAIPAGLGLVRTEMPGREAVAALFRIPLQVPVVIIGLAFFYTYYALSDAVGISLAGTFTGLVIAHFFILSPFVIGGVTAVLQRFDERLEEAAASLGAGHWRTFRRVTLPVILPGLFAGASYAFMVSFGDVPVSLFLAGPDMTTFPVAIFHSMDMDFDTRVLSSSTMAMVFGLILLLLVQKLIGLDRFAHSQIGANG
jgi:ABC-type spermidine/putrescine transport system permease subunit II